MFIKLGGKRELWAVIDDADADIIGQHSWCPVMGRNGIIYAASRKNGKFIYMHRFIMGIADMGHSVCIDHIDHNGLNNSRTNLRITDNRGNQRNTKKRLSAKNTSSYKGVSHRTDNRKNPWQARIFLSGKNKYLGVYRTQEDAAKAYNQAATEVFGPFALLNDIGPSKSCS